MGCCGCLELPQREVLEWGGTDKDVGPPPPRCHVLSPLRPSLCWWEERGWGGHPPPLGAPCKRGAAGVPGGGGTGKGPSLLTGVGRAWVLG